MEQIFLERCFLTILVILTSNIVLMTKQFDADGYDVKLRECIKIGAPEKFDINELKCDERLANLLNKNELSSDPFLWGMESISDDYQPI